MYLQHGGIWQGLYQYELNERKSILLHFICSESHSVWSGESYILTHALVFLFQMTTEGLVL